MAASTSSKIIPRKVTLGTSLRVERGRLVIGDFAMCVGAHTGHWPWLSKCFSMLRRSRVAISCNHWVEHQLPPYWAHKLPALALHELPRCDVEKHALPESEDVRAERLAVSVHLDNIVVALRVDRSFQICARASDASLCLVQLVFACGASGARNSGHADPQARLGKAQLPRARSCQVARNIALRARDRCVRAVVSPFSLPNPHLGVQVALHSPKGAPPCAIVRDPTKLFARVHGRSEKKSDFFSSHKLAQTQDFTAGPFVEAR